MGKKKRGYFLTEGSHAYVLAHFAYRGERYALHDRSCAGQSSGVRKFVKERMVNHAMYYSTAHGDGTLTFTESLYSSGFRIPVFCCSGCPVLCSGRAAN